MRTWSLRTLFLIFAIASLIPFTAVLGYAANRDHDRRLAQEYASEITLASSVSRSISSNLAANTDALEGITQLPSMVQLDAAAAEIDLGEARRVRPELSSIFLVDAEKNIITSSGTDPESLLSYISNQVDEVVAQNTAAVSPRVPISEDTYGIVVLVPVTTVQETTTSTDTGNAAASNPPGPTPTPVAGGSSEASTQPPGRTIGVIGGVIQIDRLSQSVMPSNRGSSEIAVATEMDILFSTGGIDRENNLLITNHQDVITLALEGESASFRMTDINGTDRAAVAVPVGYEAAPWTVIVTKPTPSILDGISRPEAFIVLALALMVIIALAMVLSEITARPVRTLSRQARELHQGTLKDPIVPLGGGEIRTLSERFAEMADQINAQVAGLEENRHDRERQAAQMRDLLRRTNRMQEDERRRIAGEIHDAVSPLITGALYQARALQMTNGSTPEEELDSSLKSVSELLEQATNELHGVIFDLRPPDLDDLGLVAAIEAFVHTIQRTGLSARLEVSGEAPNLTPEVRLSLYRIVQEALHNVVRHAGADEAVVRLETTPELVRLTIRDNGAGFDPAQAVQPTSLGLLSMHERAEAIGASFTIVSRPGGGTAIVIERANSGDVMSDEVLESMMSMSNGTSGADSQNVADDEPEPAVDIETSNPAR